MRFLLGLSFAVLVTLVPASAGNAESSPALETSVAALDKALHCPTAFDDTKNEPVLLVHGTFTDDGYNWNWNYLPALTGLGFDVCTVTLPDHSLSDMQIQAEYVVHAVRRMHAASGDPVDIVGSSQGTLHPRWAVKWWPDVRAIVDDIVQLAAPNHGTIVTALGTSFGRCFASCWQMAQGSNYIAALNADDETPGDISYTSLYTLTDELVQPQLPTSTSHLDGASNIAIQDVCPTRPADHVSLSTGDAVGFALALDAFTHPGAANTSRFDIATCAQPFIPGTNPADLFTTQGSAAFDGEYEDAEPPLKAYTRATQVQGTTETNAPEGVAAEEVAAGEPSLPATGMNLLGLVALSLGLIAAGGNLLQVVETRSSRSAERRTLPASSRSASDTNS
jgi:hypothetical protein